VSDNNILKTQKLKTQRSVSEKIFGGIGILLNGFFSFFGISEFYIVAIKKDTELYPFGGEGPVPYYYETAELYATVSLIYGIAFGILLGIGIWNWKKNKINELIIFGITCLFIFIQIYHGWAE
jgi:hypothetical protein